MGASFMPKIKSRRTRSRDDFAINTPRLA